MKKYSLTLILVLVLFVITGGTYAAWNYFDGQATALESTQDPTISFDTTVNNSPKGKIEIVHNDLKVLIGPKSETDYTTNLTFEGSIEIKFTPTTENGNSTIADFKGWNVAVALSGLKSQYNKHDIFTVVASTDIDGSSNVVIDSSTFATYVTFTPDVLATASEHEAYKTALGTPKITFAFSEQSAA